MNLHWKLFLPWFSARAGNDEIVIIVVSLVAAFGEQIQAFVNQKACYVIKAARHLNDNA